MFFCYRQPLWLGLSWATISFHLGLLQCCPIESHLKVIAEITIRLALDSKFTPTLLMENDHRSLARCPCPQCYNPKEPIPTGLSALDLIYAMVNGVTLVTFRPDLHPMLQQALRKYAYAGMLKMRFNIEGGILRPGAAFWHSTPSTQPLSFDKHRRR